MNLQKKSSQNVLKRIFGGLAITFRYSDYLERLTQDGTCLVCVGKTEDLNKMPEGNHHAMTQQLGIPLTVTNLKICISTLHNLQSVLDKVHQEKNKVAEASEEVKYVLSISRELEVDPTVQTKNSFV